MICRCPAPRHAAGEGTCRNCGLPVRAKVTPATWRIALALAEIALGRRRAGDMRQGGDRRPRGGS